MRRKKTTEGVVAHFAGHETFPLRQMWLKKAFDQAVDGVVKRSSFADEAAIAEFGVGKNMVAAIRHWALACDVIKEPDGNADYPVAENGRLIFADDGYDPYAEHPTTAWYCHWCLAGRGKRSTTWYWLFNHVVGPTFTRDELEEPLADYAKSIDANRRLSPATFSRDIETCLRGYAPRASGASPEEYAEPMLAELGRVVKKKSAKPQLPLRLVSRRRVRRWLQGRISVGSQNSQKFQHRQVRKLLVVKPMAPDVLVDGEVDIVDSGPHCDVLTVTGLE